MTEITLPISLMAVGLGIPTRPDVAGATTAGAWKDVIARSSRLWRVSSSYRESWFAWALSRLPLPKRTHPQSHYDFATERLRAGPSPDRGVLFCVASSPGRNQLDRLPSSPRIGFAWRYS